MKVSVAILLAFTACIVGTALGETCTKQTCTGPVTASFSGFDCQGSPTSYSQTTNASAVGSCIPTSDGSFRVTCNSAGFVYETYLDSSCTLLNLIQRMAVGVCINALGEAGSSVALCNVNDTFSNTATRPDTSLPTVSTQTRACSSADGCTEPLFTVNYSGDNCQGATGARETLLGANYTEGACLYDSNSLYNLVISCGSDGTYSEKMYQTSPACSGTPAYDYTFSTNCLGKSQRFCVSSPAAPAAPASTPTSTPVASPNAEPTPTTQQPTDSSPTDSSPTAPIATAPTPSSGNRSGTVQISVALFLIATLAILL